MRKRWIATLSSISLVLLVIIGVFIGAQFRDPDYQPRFRLTEKSDKIKCNSKEVLELKSNLMSSIAKNCRGNLKGEIPESLDFDLSKTEDEGGKSLIKLFDVPLIEISGLKGFTYVLKETLPINKYTYKEDLQTGLLTNTPMEAIMTYFRDDKVYERPVMVCPVISIDNKDFDCYLRNSDNDWVVFENINELNPTQPDFADKAFELIENHYNPSSESSESSEDDSQEASKQDTQQYESLELDLSKRDGFSNDSVQVSEVTRIKIPGCKGYSHKFKNKSTVSKYQYMSSDQEGLPTDTPLDAVLTFLGEDAAYNFPLVVCPVTSAKSRQLTCYLRNPDGSWSMNEEISELKQRDPNLGEKAAKIIHDHYHPPEPLDKKSYNQEVVYTFSDDPKETTPEFDNREPENDSSTSASEQESENKEEPPTVPEDLEVDLSNTGSDHGFTKVSEVEDVNFPGYKGYTHVFNTPTKVNTYKYNHQEQQGLPKDVDLDGVLVFFNKELDDKPLAVCGITSIDNMDFDCYLRNSNDYWSKNNEISALDIAAEDFGEKASKIVNQHYGFNNQNE